MLVLKKTYQAFFILGVFLIPFNSDIPKWMGFLGEYSSDSSPLFFIISFIFLLVYQLKSGKIYIPYRTVEYQLLLLFIAVLIFVTLLNMHHIIDYYFKQTSGVMRFVRQLIALLISAGAFFYTFLNVGKDFGALPFFFLLRKLFFISFVLVFCCGFLEFLIVNFNLIQLRPVFDLFDVFPFVNARLDFKLTRVSSLTYEPPALGSYLITAAGFLFSYILTEKKIIRFLPFILLVFLAIVSKSRTAFVVILLQTFVGVVLTYIYYKDFRRYFNIAIVFAVIGITSMTLVYREPIADAIEERISSFDFTDTKFSQTNNSVSNKSRLGIQTAMIQTIKEYPIFGTGWGQQAFVSRYHYPNWALKNNYEFTARYKNQFDKSFPPGFNLYLRIAAEAGVVGLISFLLFLFVILYNTTVWFKKDTQTKFIPTVLLISFVGYSLNWLQIDSFKLYGFWLCLALFILYKNRALNTPQ